MLSSFESDVRVRLTGTVGTHPGLLGKRQFVIHNEQGRGLLIQGNDKQPTPPYGSTIQITGTLLINDDGISLKMLARDRWTRLKSQTLVEPRAVDLFAPLGEDIWSLIQVTGTVRGVERTTVELETEDLAMKAVIKSATRYRAGRLKTGDVVHITGILDARTDDTKIYPRSVDDIALVTRVKKIEAKKPIDNVPPWTPIGSAGATVALAQGYKYFRKKREQKRLSSLLSEAETALTETVNKNP